MKNLPLVLLIILFMATFAQAATVKERLQKAREAEQAVTVFEDMEDGQDVVVEKQGDVVDELEVPEEVVKKQTIFLISDLNSNKLPEDGTYVAYYDNGGASVEFVYKNGIMVKSVTYFENGSIKSEAENIDTLTLSADITNYLEDGRVSSVVTLKNGVAVDFVEHEGSGDAEAQNRYMMQLHNDLVELFGPLKYEGIQK